MNTLTFEPVMPWWAMIAAAVALSALLLLRPTFHPVSRRRQLVLSALRLGVTVLVVAALARPSCIRTIQREQSATVLLLCDLSRSMQLPHESAGATRWERMLQMFRENQTELQQLSDKLKVVVLGFDGSLIPLEYDQGAIQFPSLPQGGQTDMGSTLDQSLQDLRSQRLIATLILGDGVQNVDDPLVELPEAVRQLERLQRPLFTVPFGQQADAGQLADVAVENMPDQLSVFVKNQLLVRVTLRVRGYANQEIPVQLILEDQEGNQQIVQTERVLVREDDQQIPLAMKLSPEQAGQFKLIVKAEQQPRETVVRNNQLPAFLTVYEGGLGVLYLEGLPRLEQKFLKRSLAESQDIQLDTQIIAHRDRGRWPVQMVDTFRDPKYDVFIIGNLDSRALHQDGVYEENLRALSQAVENGKGLLMLGGEHSFGPGRYHSTPLSAILPIRMQKYEAQDFDAPINREYHLDRPLQMQPTGNHFLTRLGDAANHQNLWQFLPPLDGANRFDGIKDRSQVLAESRHGDPLLISGNYGGRVLAFAGDSSWRWWMQGHQELHKRFWRQAILWLAKRDGLTNDNVWVSLPQRRFTPGSKIDFTAGVRTAAGDDVRGADLSCYLVQPDKQRVLLRMMPGLQASSGQIDRELLTAPGTYAIEASASLNDAPIGSTRTEFIVVDQDREKSNPAADPGQLARMASQTQAWGGRAVPPEEFGQLLRDIENQPLELSIEIPEKWQLGDTWQDAWLFFLFLVGLLASEWALRKKWGLV